MNRFSLMLSIALLVGLAALSGCWQPTEGATVDSAGSGSSELDPPVLVRLGEFTRGTVSSTLRVHADLVAVERAEVYPEISGVVGAVLAREGDTVEKDQPIVQLRDEELRLTAEVKDVMREQAGTRVRQSELAVEELSGTAETKRLLVEKARSEFERLAELYSEEAGAESIISKEEYEGKRYALEEARLNAAAAEIQLAKARADLTLAQQSAREAELQHRTAEYQLSRAVLRSPISGGLTFLELRPGELVGPSTLAFSVVDPAQLEARLFVPQRELGRLAVGQLVRIESEVFPGELFRGTVDVINPAVDPENGMVRVIVGVDDPHALGRLRPGMYISGEIVVETRDDALLVSKKAIVYENQKPILFLVQEDVAHRYLVEKGHSSAESVEVLGITDASGTRLTEIPAGARPVVQGHNNLRDGSRIEEEEPASAGGAS